jgi:hypothetical protein
VQPSEQTCQLYRRICEDFAPAMPAKDANKNGCFPEGYPSPLQAALNQLIEVRTALGVLQNAVNESLERVRQALQSSDHSSGLPN